MIFFSQPLVVFASSLRIGKLGKKALKRKTTKFTATGTFGRIEAILISQAFSCRSFLSDLVSFNKALHVYKTTKVCNMK